MPTFSRKAPCAIFDAIKRSMNSSLLSRGLFHTCVSGIRVLSIVVNGNVDAFFSPHFLSIFFIRLVLELCRIENEVIRTSAGFPEHGNNGAGKKTTLKMLPR